MDASFWGWVVGRLDEGNVLKILSPVSRVSRKMLDVGSERWRSCYKIAVSEVQMGKGE